MTLPTRVPLLQVATPPVVGRDVLLHLRADTSVLVARACRQLAHLEAHTGTLTAGEVGELWRLADELVDTSRRSVA